VKESGHKQRLVGHFFANNEVVGLVVGLEQCRTGRAMEVSRKGWSERRKLVGNFRNLEYLSSGCESRPAKAKTRRPVASLATTWVTTAAYVGARGREPWDAFKRAVDDVLSWGHIAEATGTEVGAVNRNGVAPNSCASSSSPRV